MKRIYPYVTLGISALALLFSSCNNGGGGSSGSSDSSTAVTSYTNPEKYSALLIDSPIQGLFYKTAVTIPGFANLQGITDQDGSFEFYAGYPVIFYAGNVKFGQVTLSDSDNPVITPLGFSGYSNIDSTATQQLLRLLQSLDDNSDLDDGIQITSTYRTELSDEMYEYGESISEVLAKLPENSDIYNQINLITAASAKAHLEQSLEAKQIELFNEFVANNQLDATTDTLIDASKLVYVLPERYRGMDITWTLSNNGLSSNNRIQRPANGKSDIFVDATADVSFGSIQSSLSTRLYVKAFPVITSISVSQSNVIIDLGKTVPISVTGTSYTDATEDITAQVTFTSSNQDIANVINGKIVTSQEGNTVITATYDEYTAKIYVTVGPKVIESIEILPLQPEIIYEDTLQMQLNAEYSNNTSGALDAVWSIDDMNPEGIAEINANSGLLTLLQDMNGTVSVNAEFEGVLYSTTVTANQKDRNTPTLSAQITNLVNGSFILSDGLTASATVDISADDDFGIAAYRISESAEEPTLTSSGWVSVNQQPGAFNAKISQDLTAATEDADDGIQRKLYVWVRDTQNISPVNELNYLISTAIDYSDATLNPLADNQWHLQNTAQKNYSNYSGTSGYDLDISYVHNTMGYKGRGVVIGMLDSGVEATHPDLGTDVVVYSETDAAADQVNGTAHAGLMAMRANNGEGGVGVAPKVTIRSYITLADNDVNDGLQTGEEAALQHSEPNVYSLHYTNYYKTAADRSAIFNTMESIVGNSTIPYFKAAGDFFYSDQTSDSCDSNGCQNVAHDPRNAVKRLIVVGAQNASGTKASYSAVGSGLWVTAPGGEEGYGPVVTKDNPKNFWIDEYDSSEPFRLNPALFSVDVTGSDGLSPQYYMKDTVVFGTTYDVFVPKNLFNGIPYLSSADESAPADNPSFNYNASTFGSGAATSLASGVTALLLEAKPSLTSRQIAYVLAQTAKKIDLSDSIKQVSVNGSNVTVHSGWVTNGAGVTFNTKYGFGAVNAKTAMKYILDASNDAALAAFSTNSGTEINSTVTGSSLNLTIPTNKADGVSSELSLASTISSIETVQVKLNITHTNVKKLLITLISPSGTKSILYTPGSIYSGSALTNFYLRSNAFLDESANGNWTLTVIDTESGSTGTINDWSLNVFGH